MNKRKEKSMYASVRRTVLLCFAICGVLCAVAICSVFQSFSAQFAQQQFRVAESYYTRIQLGMEDAAKYSRQIISNETIQRDLVDIHALRGQARGNAQMALQTALTLSIGQTLPYADLIIVTDNIGGYYSYLGSLVDGILREKLEHILEDTPSTGKLVWHSETLNGETYLVQSRAIREYKNLTLQVLGYEAIFLNVHKMLGYMSQESTQDDDHSAVLFDGDWIFRDETCVLPVEELPAEGQWKTIFHNGQIFFVTCGSFFDGRMQIVNYARYDHLGRNAMVAISMVLGILMVLALLLWVSLRRINLVFSSMNRLSETVQQVKEGDFHVRVDKDLLSAEGEVGLFARKFQDMTDEMDQLVNQRLKRQLYMTQAQCRMLQAQIHPHFLYNTLETIHAMAAKSGDERLSRITMSLSRLVRASYRGKMFAPLRDEIAFVREYLTIYRIRFGQRLSAVIEYDPQDEEVLLPQMTLQPLVENSIRYGLMKKMERGVIRLRIRHSNGRLRISLYDNGIGFPEEQAKLYEHLPAENEFEIHGFGNVVTRLRYTYGQDMRLTVHSKTGTWTNLGIDIPDTLPERFREEETNDQNSVGRR